MHGSDVITACSDPHFNYVWGDGDPVRSDPGLPRRPGQIRDVEEADLGLEWSKSAVARGAQIVYVNSRLKTRAAGNTSGGAITAWHWAVDKRPRSGHQHELLANCGVLPTHQRRRLGGGAGTAKGQLRGNYVRERQRRRRPGRGAIPTAKP